MVAAEEKEGTAEGEAKRRPLTEYRGGDGLDGVKPPQDGVNGSGLSAELILALMIGTIASNVAGARLWRSSMASAAKRKEVERLAQEARRRAQANFGSGSSRQGQQNRGTSGGQSAGTSEVRQHLDTLGISDVHTGEKEVKAAFRARVLRLHPDRNSNSSAFTKKANEREFKRVAEAYAWLERNRLRQCRYK